MKKNIEFNLVYRHRAAVICTKNTVSLDRWNKNERLTKISISNEEYFKLTLRFQQTLTSRKCKYTSYLSFCADRNMDSKRNEKENVNTVIWWNETNPSIKDNDINSVI